MHIYPPQSSSTKERQIKSLNETNLQMATAKLAALVAKRRALLKKATQRVEQTLRAERELSTTRERKVKA